MASNPQGVISQAPGDRFEVVEKVQGHDEVIGAAAGVSKLGAGPPIIKELVTKKRSVHL